MGPGPVGAKRARHPLVQRSASKWIFPQRKVLFCPHTFWVTVLHSAKWTMPPPLKITVGESGAVWQASVHPLSHQIIGMLWYYSWWSYTWWRYRPSHGTPPLSCPPPPLPPPPLPLLTCIVLNSFFTYEVNMEIIIIIKIYFLIEFSAPRDSMLRCYVVCT